MPFLLPVIIKFIIIQMPIVKHINKNIIPRLPFEVTSFTAYLCDICKFQWYLNIMEQFFPSLYAIFMNSYASCFKEYRTYIPHIIISLIKYNTCVWPVSCFTTIILSHYMYPKASITLPKTNLSPCQCILLLHSTSKRGKSSFHGVLIFFIKLFW